MNRDTRNFDRWTVADSTDLYGIGSWSQGYFRISKDGDVVADLANGDRTREVGFADIVSGLKERGLALPVLLRFGGILDSRISLLNEKFAKAMRELGYQGAYRGVYPIKVNQQQQVLEEITRFGRRYHHGLEAGSKAELIAALAYLHDPEAFIICNGYKDEEFIDLALYATQMGLRTILVVEMSGELPLIMKRAEELGIEPCIGVRVKLATRGSGHWIESGGDRSVFGLNTAQIIDVVDHLKESGKLHCLKLLHYHVGSQIPNVRTLRSAASEATRVYVDLVKEGAPMEILNIGGGLAVDYDGSQTNFEASSNYSVEEYCADIVDEVMTGCDEENVPHPTLISESGRALVAYYSVLLFNILDATRFQTHNPPETLPEESHEMLLNLREVRGNLSTKNVQECYNDAVYYRDEIRGLFLRGILSLRERALGEQMFWDIMSAISREVKKLKYVPEDLQELDAALADIYYGNFSLFQSIPDSWAIDQLFPIMPVHRLNERPTRNAVLADITCDCDGKIDRFIDLHDVKRSLLLHELTDGADYVLGVFLVGAYQETLGDLHNLFGDTNVVSIGIDEAGELEYEREIHGDSVADVLSYVEYEPRDLKDGFRQLAEQAVRAGTISPKERRTIMQAYEEGLRGYTYFEE
ncbi:MAG: biosynthetic arginine decarboxylase [Verrucomicrobia bacterium]|nr:biosynthetic arginine decarboxylase [Verrucomicrobiota bacterium]